MGLANSIGTFDNFKKQPVDTPIGSYDGFKAVNPADGQVGQVLDALSGLAGAVNLTFQQDEEYRKAYGIKRAEELIASTNEKDKIELDTRTILQNVGLVELQDNPYAMTLLEKDVGKAIASNFSRTYKENLSQNQNYKKTRAEQLADFNKQRTGLFDDLKDKRHFENPAAFEEGFNESYLADEGNVYDMHTKFMSDQSVKEATTILMNNLSNVDLDKAVTEGTYGKVMGEIVSKAMLQNVPEDKIAESLSKKFQAYTESGGHNKDVIKQLEETNVGLWKTGEKFGQAKTYKDWMGGDMKPLEEAIDSAQDRYYTKRDSDITRGFEEAMMKSPDAVWDYYNKLSDHEKKKYADAARSFDHRAYEVRRAAEQKRLQASQKKVLQSDARLRIDRAVATLGNMKIADASGKALPTSPKQIGCTDDDLIAYLEENSTVFLSKENGAEDLMRVIASPLFSGVKSRVEALANSALWSLAPNMANDSYSCNKYINALDNYYMQFQANPSMFQGAYGDKMYSAMQSYGYLRANNSPEQTAIQFSTAMAAERPSFENTNTLASVKQVMSETGSISLSDLTGGSRDFDIMTTPGISDLIYTYAKSYTEQGLTPQQAVESAVERIQSDNYAFHFNNSVTMIPHYVTSDLGVSTEALDKALTWIAYDYDQNHPGKLQCYFDTGRSKFVVGMMDSGYSESYSIADIRGYAQSYQEQMDSETSAAAQAQAKEERTAASEPKHWYDFIGL